MESASVYRLSFAVVLLAAGCGTTKPASTDPTGGTASRTAASQQSGGVEISYDQAKDTTLVRLRSVPVVGEATTALVLGATHPGRTLRRPETVLLGFSRSAAAWRWEGCQSLTLLGDGRSLVEVPVSRDTQLGDGQLTEIVSTVVPYEVVRVLAQVAQPAVKLCGEDRPLSEKERTAIRQFVQRLP